MSRFFNISGPNREGVHYGLDPLKRIDYNSLVAMINLGRYFSVCSPKQSGKTTLFLALQKKINEEGRYRCLYCNIEAAQVADNDIKSGIHLLLNRISQQAESVLGDPWPFQNVEALLDRFGPECALVTFFERWLMQADTNSKPLVLIFDGIDLLRGKTLASILSQLRTGQINSPKLFPQSVILSGVRDIRDVDVEIGDGKFLIGRTVSDIREKSFALRNFSHVEIKELCDQYTEETGQTFQKFVAPRLFSLTGGRPWLVNAILGEALYEMGFGSDISRSITPGMIDAAKDHFIARQEAYMDQLSTKLTDPTIRETLFPILTGGSWKNRPPQKALNYLEDLELIQKFSTGWGITNAMYREIVPKVMGMNLKDELARIIDRSTFLKPDGRLNFRGIVEYYQKIFCEYFLTWGRRYDLQGVLAQILLHTFLHYVLGDHGRMECDYALGTGRVDISVGWGYTMATGERKEERFVIEIRLFDNTKSHDASVRNGVMQTVAYAQPRQVQEVYLIILDEDDTKTWYDRLYQEEHTYNDINVSVYGL